MGGDIQIQVYKCPSCGGAVTFNANAGRLTCAWCGNAFDEKDLEVKRTTAAVEGYLCPECGAQLMQDDFIAAYTCPYCGNNEVAPHRFEGKFEPDYVIRFALSKREAIERYEADLATKRFLPDDFTSEARIISTQGTYVPFWLNSGVVDFDLTFRADYKKDSKSPSVYTYHHRVGTYDYSRVPADGSERMADDMMDSIEPYDYTKLEPFSTGALPGFVAERYTVSVEQANARVDSRVAQSAINAAKSTVTYPHKRPVMYANHCRTFGHRQPAEQALLPVWLLVIAYKGSKYLVGVNGQTGKVAVNLPIDERKQSAERTRKMILGGLKGLGEALAILAIFIGCLMLAVKSTNPLDAINAFLNVKRNEGDFPYMQVLMCAVFAILFGGVTISEILRAGRTSVRKTKASMQNVQVARDADTFDEDGLTLTVNEEGVGPAVR